MRLRSGRSVLLALCLWGSGCSGEPEDALIDDSLGGVTEETVELGGDASADSVAVEGAATSTSPDSNQAVADLDPARCLVIPQTTPIGGVDLIVTNINSESLETDSPAPDIHIYRDGVLQSTVSPAPGGLDPKLADDPYSGGRFDQVGYFTDFDTPLGATLTYTATTGDDPLTGDLCGVIEVPEIWPTPTCTVEIIDGFPHLILDKGFGFRTYQRNGEPLTISSPPGLRSSELFDADPLVGIPLNYRVVSNNDRWPETTSDCGTVTIATAPMQEGLLEQAQKRLEGTLGPFWYTTIVPICPNCEEDLELTYAFDFDGKVLGTWRNGFEAEPSPEPWRILPTDLATYLLAQREAGESVEVVFVGETNVIASWTVNGIGAEVLCASVDTAPLALRTPFCEPEFFD